VRVVGIITLLNRINQKAQIMTLSTNIKENLQDATLIGLDDNGAGLFVYLENNCWVTIIAHYDDNENETLLQRLSTNNEIKTLEDITF